MLIEVYLYDSKFQHVKSFFVEDGASLPRVLEINKELYVYNHGAGSGTLHYASSNRWVLTWDEINSGNPIPTKINL